jgi:hypothetical protein
MELANIPSAVINAHFQLMALNFGSWKPDVEQWLHSEDAQAPLRELLANVPCSPTIH